MSASAEVPRLESPEVHIDRRGLAAQIIGFILGAQSKVVILHGKAGSGKTDLLTRLVLPDLRMAIEKSGGDVLYGDCAPGLPSVFMGLHSPSSLPEIVATKSIVLVDSFDNIFALGRDEQRDTLDRLFELVLRPDSKVTVVLVTDTRQLTNVYALTSYEPGIMSAVFEVKSIGIAEGLAQLNDMDQETAAPASPEVVQALSEETGSLEEQGWDVTVGLIKLIDARFRRFRSQSGEPAVGLPHYHAMGGLLGILRAHLEERLEQLETERPGDREIGSAILQRVFNARAGGTWGADFGDIPSRLGVPDGRIHAVVAKLAASPVFLRRLETGDYDLIPQQLGAILKQDSIAEALENQRPRRIVEEGLKSWQLLGNLLPRQRFEEVHRARTHLALESDEVRFLLQCALRYEGGRSEGVAEYWLRRVDDAVDGMDILLSGLFDDGPGVRLRAAALLQGFAEPEVRTRLHALAVSDPAPEVRAQAVSSLASMTTDELMELLLQEAQDRKSPHRAEAIEALRIFPTERVASLLQAVVNDPDTDTAVRQKAIRVLSRLDLKQSIDALLDIGLHDQDEEDRLSAAGALASIGSKDLNQRLLSRLQAPRRIARNRLSRIAISLLALLGASLFSFIVVARPQVLLLSLLLLIPTGLLLARLRARRIKRASIPGVLAAVLFALSTVSIFYWVHGLAHLITGRWKRGLVLLTLEILGVAFVVASPWFEQAHAVLGWFYSAVGYTLFVGSYLYDILAVLGDSLLLTGTATLEKRRAAIHQQIFANPVAAGLMFEALNSEDPKEARWAKDTFGRFGSCAQPDQLIDLLKSPEQPGLALVLRALKKTKAEETVRKLEQLWPSADGELRRRIAAVLYRRPNQRSLQALDRVREDLSPGLKLRSTLARWNFRFAVWPWPARAALSLAVLTGVVLGYHGFKSVQNPAWSLIMSLRLKPPLDWIPRESQKVAIVNFLANEYPDSSTDQELKRLFHEGKDSTPDPMRAALTLGLLKMHGGDPGAHTTPLGEELVGAARGFAGLLSTPDTSGFERALGVLRSMADVPNSVLADTAVGLLVAFVLRRPADSPEPWRIQAVDALGSVRYDRALPALDSLRRVPQDVNIESRIRDQMRRVTEQTYAALRLRSDGGRGIEDLLAVLRQLPPSPLVTGMRTELAEDIRKEKDEEASKASARTEALNVIAKDPHSEHGYRDLLNQYLQDSLYLDAKDEFVRLRKEHEGSVWPRKVLAELYHEYLALSDTAFFHRSYEEMVSLRSLPAYAELKSEGTDYPRFEADFVEVILSAKHYAETETVARQLLKLTDQPVYRLNLALFTYMAQVMAGDSESAQAKLTELEAVVKTLPKDFYNGWIYPGTIQFISTSSLPEPVKQALQKLCKEGYWYSRNDAKEILTENRTALKLMPQAQPGLAPLTLERN